MSAHPLKVITIAAIIALIGSQASLVFWLQSEYRYAIAVILTAPLLLPLKGLWNDRRYTYKWTGFLTLLYFCIGVSESFANPVLRFYSASSILLSGLLFISSIYYSRYLGQLNQR